METPGLNRLLEAIRNARNDADEIPDGWFTMRQLCEAANLQRAQMSQIVSRMIGTHVEMRMFTLQTPYGRRHVPHYRFDESAPR